MSKYLKYLLCVVACLFVFAVTSPGDVGNFNDYDSGSSWSDSSSSSSDWGNYSSSWDRDSSSGSCVSREYTKSDLVWLIALVIIVLAANAIKKGQQSMVRSPMPARVKWPEIPDHTRDITDALQKTDPDFNAVSFLEWAKEVFVNLQEAWMDRDWEAVRAFESEELYATHARQLQEYKRLGRINMVERININNAYFFSLVKDPEWETLSVVMNVRMVDYIIDEETRQVLKGSQDTDCFMSYLYVFKRKAGVQTTSGKQEADTIACPNCGAPTHVVSSGKCEFCDFVITVKDHGWVLSDIVGVKPPYNYGLGGVINKNKSEE